MADSTISANMNLVIPTVGQDPGPQWATDINTSLTLVDQHNHTPGLGVQIPPSGLNINSDLPINSNNLTLIRSSRYDPQMTPISGPSDVGAVYVSGVDLYFNDVNGTQIRLTQAGSIVGTAGSITGLVAPASASYSTVSSTFVFQSDANTPANIDGASYIFRNLVANSFGITLEPPTLSSNYALVLPSLPAQLSFLTIDASGNIAPFEAPPPVPGSTSFVTIDPAGNMGSSTPVVNGITGSNIALTGPTQSANCGSFTTDSSVPMLIPNFNISIATVGHPVLISMVPAGNAGVNPATLSAFGNNIDGSSTLQLYVYRDGASLVFFLECDSANINGASNAYLPNFSFMDTPSSGSHAYTAYIANPQGPGSASSVTIEYCVLQAYELK